MIPTKVICDQTCQFPEIALNEEASDNTDSYGVIKTQPLIKILSKNISLLQEKTFEIFFIENLYVQKRRYIQVNKTKEEMTKFFIRRCIQFINTQINYQEKDNLGAEERDRLFYHTVFFKNKEFMKKLDNDSIDELIQFRKESKLKTINDTYLKKLFKSKYFSYFYQQVLTEFQRKCQLILQQKINTYRRYRWKIMNFLNVKKSAQEIYQKYQIYKFTICLQLILENQNKLLKMELIKSEHIELFESKQ